MKTDAYTMCRGAGHIADKVSHLSDAIQAICQLCLPVNAYPKRLQVIKSHTKQLFISQHVRISYKFNLWVKQAIPAIRQCDQKYLQEPRIKPEPEVVYA